MKYTNTISNSNQIVIEQTLVSKINEESLIWAMDQYGIGNAFNNIYKLNNDLMKSCNTMAEIYSHDELLDVILYNDELRDMVMVYPGYDFVAIYREKYSLEKCLTGGKTSTLFELGEEITIPLNTYGDQVFYVCDKDYDAKDTICLMLKNPYILNEYSYANEKVPGKYSENLFKAEIDRRIDDFSDTIKNSIKTVTRRYARKDYGGSSSSDGPYELKLYPMGTVQSGIEKTNVNASYESSQYAYPGNIIKTYEGSPRNWAAPNVWFQSGVFSQYFFTAGVVAYSSAISANALGIVYGFTI